MQIAASNAQHLAAMIAVAAAALPALAQQQPPAPPPAPPAPPAEEPEDADKTIIINPTAQGWSVLELFAWIHKSTGRSILYDDTTNTKLKTAKVQFIGSYEIKSRDLFDWLQAVLSFNNMVLVPVGPRSPDGEQQWFCLDLNNPMVKTKPVYVEEKDIWKYQDRDGLYIVTTFTLQHISDTSRVRQALTSLTTQTASIGRIQDVPGSRAVIVGDFAPVVAAMKKLVDYIDIDNPRIEPRMEVLYLTHAVASELGPIVSELIESGEVAQRRPPQQGQADEEPAPKILADDRLDALIVYSTDRYMEKIKTLVGQLDIPSRARGRLHFRSLKHTDAVEMANLLGDLIEGADSTTTGGGRTTRSTTAGRTTRTTANVPSGGAPGTAAFGASAAEGRPVIIPDPKTNSLIIHSSPTTFIEIDELISKLDTSRPQVLIETALVELALNDALSLGVELFGSQKGIAVDTNNDGTPDTLTQDRKGFGGTAYGLSDLVTVDVNGVKVPTNRSPLFGTGLTAGIFNNGKLAASLSALQESSRAKILTRPSLVANDNEQATIRISRETSYRENVRTDTNTTSDSFKTVTADSELTISPHISSESFLRLEIEQSVANFGDRPSPDAPPNKTERSIRTNVTIPDAYTVVLGGIIQEEESSSVSKVPFLGDIPVIGFFFRQTVDTSKPQQLFLFVTPRILRDMDGFKELHQATWERKLLNDTIFQNEVKLGGTNFRGPADTTPVSPSERLEQLEKSGALDGVRVKSPPSDEERLRAAEQEFRKSQNKDGGK